MQSMSETFNTRHTITGALQRLTEIQILPFKDYLEIVPDDAKPYAPGMFKPGKVGQFDNPEPETDAITAARANYARVLEDHAPNSKVARAVKAELNALLNEYEEDLEDAEETQADLGQPDDEPTVVDPVAVPAGAAQGAPQDQAAEDSTVTDGETTDSKENE